MIDPLYVISGVLVGTLVGFTGVGGGSLMTPLLILVFGVSPTSAVGTDLLYAAATKTAGSAVHGFNKTVDWKVVFKLAAGSLPATALTIVLLWWLGIDSKSTQQLITKVLGAAILLTALSLVFRKPMMRLYDRRIGELSPALVTPLTIAVGALLGVLVTISSVGAGAIGVTALVSQDADAADRRLRHRACRAADAAGRHGPLVPRHHRHSCAAVASHRLDSGHRDRQSFRGAGAGELHPLCAGDGAVPGVRPLLGAGLLAQLIFRSATEKGPEAEAPGPYHLNECSPQTTRKSPKPQVPVSSTAMMRFPERPPLMPSLPLAS